MLTASVLGAQHDWLSSGTQTLTFVSNQSSHSGFTRIHFILLYCWGFCQHSLISRASFPLSAEQWLFYGNSCGPIEPVYFSRKPWLFGRSDIKWGSFFTGDKGGSAKVFSICLELGYFCRRDHVFTWVLLFFFSKYGRRFISLKTHETLIKQQSCNEIHKTNDHAKVMAVGRKKMILIKKILLFQNLQFMLELL